MLCSFFQFRCFLNENGALLYDPKIPFSLVKAKEFLPVCDWARIGSEFKLTPHKARCTYISTSFEVNFSGSVF
jgi:hypothetical protein